MKPVAYYGEERKPLGDDFGYDDIDRSLLTHFSIEDEGDELIRVHLEQNKRLIWRKRVFMKPRHKFTVHLLGWQRTVNGVNVQSIAYVFPHGHIEMKGRFEEGHPIFDKINYTEDELEDTK